MKRCKLFLILLSVLLLFSTVGFACSNTETGEKKAETDEPKTKIEYTITYNANGGVGLMQEEKGYENDKISLLTNAFTRENYSFIGWAEESDGEVVYLDKEELTLTKNMTLYAIWQKDNEYTIIFNSNNGVGQMDKITSFCGEDVTLPLNTFTKENYTFVNWNTKADGSGDTYSDGATVNFTSATILTLYANWHFDGYNVTINYISSWKASSNDAPISITQDSVELSTIASAGNTYESTTKYDVGTVVNYTITATNSEIDWYITWNTTGEEPVAEYKIQNSCTPSITIGESNVIYIFVWKIYTISYNANLGEGTTPKAQYKPYNTSNNTYSIILADACFTREGYIQVAWQNSGKTKTYALGSKFSNNTSMTMYAKWEQLFTYTINYASLSRYTKTSINVETSSGTLSASTLAVGESATLTLQNSETAIDITVSPVNTERYYHFATAEITETPTTIVSTLKLSWTPTVDATVNIYGVQMYKITYDLNGGAGTLPATQYKVYDKDKVKSITLSNTQLTKSGYTHTGWNTSADGTGTHYDLGESYVSNLSKEPLYAEWVASNNCTITFDKNGGTGTMSKLSGVSGSQVTLTANKFTYTDYTFAGWSTTATGEVEYANKASITLSENMTLFAVWTYNATTCDSMITALSTTYSEEAVSEARTYFDGLSDSAKQDVANYEKLVNYEFNISKKTEIASSKTDLQQVLLRTAYSYYYQGNQIQYDQYNNIRNLCISPNSASSENSVFLDCSSFICAVYYNALGIYINTSVGSNMSTANLSTYAKSGASDVLYSIDTTQYTTTTAQDNLLSTIRSNLQVGDVLVYRHGKTADDCSGHVIMYIGDGKYIHCIGTCMKVNIGTTNPDTFYDGQTETEKTSGAIGVGDLSIYFDRDYTQKRYLFNDGSTNESYKVWYFAVIRPLLRSDVQEPSTSGANYYVSNGITTEKHADISNYQGVTNGQNITITVTAQNNLSTAFKVVNIVEKIPTGSTFVWCSEGGVYNKSTNKIVWTLSKISANGTKSVSYTYKVKGDIGDVIVDNNTTTNGINTNTLRFPIISSSVDVDLIESTLLESIGSTSYQSVLDLENKAYSVGNGGTSNVLSNYSSVDDVVNSLFVDNTLQSSSDLYPLVYKVMFGGKKANIQHIKNNVRIRNVRSAFLMSGDFIVAYTSYTSSCYAFIYVNSSNVLMVSGGTVVNKCSTESEVDAFLITLTAYDRYAILRPSLDSNTGRWTENSGTCSVSATNACVETSGWKDSTYIGNPFSVLHNASSTNSTYAVKTMFTCTDTTANETKSNGIVKIGYCPYFKDKNNFILIYMYWENISSTTSMYAVNANICYNGSWADKTIAIIKDNESFKDLWHNSNFSSGYMMHCDVSKTAIRVIINDIYIGYIETDSYFDTLVAGSSVALYSYNASVSANNFDAWSIEYWQKSGSTYTITAEDAVEGEWTQANFCDMSIFNEVASSSTYYTSATFNVNSTLNSVQKFGYCPMYLDENNYVLVFLKWDSNTAKNKMVSVEICGKEQGSLIYSTGYYTCWVHDNSNNQALQVACEGTFIIKCKLESDGITVWVNDNLVKDGNGNSKISLTGYSGGLTGNTGRFTLFSFGAGITVSDIKYSTTSL